MDAAALSHAAAELLDAEVERLRQRGVPVGEDDLRGLYISDQEADRILRRAGDPGPPSSSSPEDLIEAMGERLAQLGRLLGLCGPESAVLALCFAGETDPDIERLIAYVQDDVSRRRPRVEVFLRLFWGDLVDAQRAFDRTAPLRRFRLIELHDDPGQAVTPLLARTVTLDARIARFLAGGDSLDERLAGAASLHHLAESRAWHAAEPPPIDPLALQPRALSLHGPDEMRNRRTAASIAQAAGLEGVVEAWLAGRELGPVEVFDRASREAALQSFVLLVHGCEALDPPTQSEVFTAVESSPAPFVILAWDGEPAWHGPAVRVERPGYEGRLAEWRANLETTPCAAAVEQELPVIAGKFELDTGAIEAAVLSARGLATTRDASSPVITVDDLYAAARARSAPILSSLASKVVERKRWEDLILEPDPLAQLHEICGMVEHRHRVYDEWGFGKKLSNGKGVVSLFAGQSGTGKTMSAGVIAAELGLDLYKIDLSGVVSKYIGETEKNLGAIFRDASLSNAILFFDEADALFGKRSEVRDAHDRYANIETAYLLQQIEEYAGPVILSTNLKANLDEAFLRRMHFVVDFPMPEEPYRLRIWRSLVPDDAPLADDVDFVFLARQFRISGGNIRNIVLASGFLAAQDGNLMTMKHFIQGTRREFQKLGRMVTEADFGEHLRHLE